MDDTLSHSGWIGTTSFTARTRASSISSDEQLATPAGPAIVHSDSSGPPLMRSMCLHIIWPGEQFNQDGARHKAANVSPECNTAAITPKAGQSTEELQHHPVNEHQPRG